MKKLSDLIGLRTIKTAAAIIIALAIVNQYGTSSAKLIFAMLGAMSAVQPTFRASLEACLTQIVGVSFGAVMGLLLRELPISYLTAVGIGVIIIITVYNSLHVTLSPPCPPLSWSWSAPRRSSPLWPMPWGGSGIPLSAWGWAL